MIPLSLLTAKKCPSVGPPITMLLTLPNAFVNVVQEHHGLTTKLAPNKLYSLNIFLVFASQRLPSVTRKLSGIQQDLPFERSSLRWVNARLLFGLRSHVRYAEKEVESASKQCYRYCLGYHWHVIAFLFGCVLKSFLVLYVLLVVSIIDLYLFLHCSLNTNTFPSLTENHRQRV